MAPARIHTIVPPSTHPPTHPWAALIPPPSLCQSIPENRCLTTSLLTRLPLENTPPSVVEAPLHLPLCRSDRHLSTSPRCARSLPPPTAAPSPRTLTRLARAGEGAQAGAGKIPPPCGGAVDPGRPRWKQRGGVLRGACRCQPASPASLACPPFAGTLARSMDTASWACSSNSPSPESIPVLQQLHDQPTNPGGGGCGVCSPPARGWAAVAEYVMPAAGEPSPPRCRLPPVTAGSRCNDSRCCRCRRRRDAAAACRRRPGNACASPAFDVNKRLCMHPPDVLLCEPWYAAPACTEAPHVTHTQRNSKLGNARATCALARRRRRRRLHESGPVVPRCHCCHCPAALPFPCCPSKATTACRRA